MNRANFKKGTIFDKTTCQLMAVHQYQSQIKFDKHIYIGFTVLELSKQMMYNLYYNIMKKLYNDDDIKILYTDADSFIYHIRTEDVYKDIEIIKDHFDTSDFPKDHYLYSEKNRKVIGKMMYELESGGKNSIPIMTEFIGLKSKTYSYNIETNNKHAFAMKAKGIKIDKIKSEVKEKNINHKDYENVLFNRTSLCVVVMYRYIVLRSYKHKIYSTTVIKKALSDDDDKRYILEDNISALAYGHYKLKD